MSSHRRSMLSLHGEKHSGNATTNPARAEGQPQLEDAGPLSGRDAAYRQSEIRTQADLAAAAAVLEARAS